MTIRAYDESYLNDAMNNLGVIYEYGKGVEIDYSKAAEWYSKAANAGNKIAKRNLELLLEYSRINGRNL